ncbi:MAG: hypothetical protein RLY70_4701 [Planctomycetota bacterium]
MQTRQLANGPFKVDSLVLISSAPAGPAATGIREVFAALGRQRRGVRRAPAPKMGKSGLRAAPSQPS